MLQILGGALIMVGGGVLSASSFGLARITRREMPGTIGEALRNVYADTASAALPAAMTELLDRLA